MAVFVPTPQYPDVPFAPGVPVMSRPPDALVGFGGVALLVEDILGAAFGSVSEWGIFDADGLSVVPHDSVVAFDYREEHAISDYPVERGGFQSYDKVAIPYDVRFRFTSYGSPAIRADFLSALATASSSLELYTATTPDAIYPSCNIVSYSYHRETRNGGVGMLLVDVLLREVRETGQTQLAQSSATDTGQSQTDGGTKQASENVTRETPEWKQQRADLLNEGTLKVSTPQGNGANYRPDVPQYVAQPGANTGATSLPQQFLSNQRSPTVSDLFERSRVENPGFLAVP